MVFETVMQIVSIIVEDGIVGVEHCGGGILLRWGNEGWGIIVVALQTSAPRLSFNGR